MNRTVRPLLFGAALTALTTLGACMPRQPKTTERLVTATAVVESVDQKTREVGLRDSATGAEFSVIAGPEVRNLPQVEAGDTVRLDFYQATTLAMATPGTVPQTTGAVAGARAPEGAKPGALAVTTLTNVVRVISYDTNSGFATFATPDGRVHRATVPPELRTFASQRRRGDLVEVTFTDALAVSITE